MIHGVSEHIQRRLRLRQLRRLRIEAMATVMAVIILTMITGSLNTTGSRRRQAIGTAAIETEETVGSRAVRAPASMPMALTVMCMAVTTVITTRQGRKTPIAPTITKRTTTITAPPLRINRMVTRAVQATGSRTRLRLRTARKQTDMSHGVLGRQRQRQRQRTMDGALQAQPSRHLPTLGRQWTRGAEQRKTRGGGKSRTTTHQEDSRAVGMRHGGLAVGAAGISQGTGIRDRQ